ncbi:DUF2806 domain-containing protein [Desulfovibrio piger]|nr:DUF2806 domain-containing protein [Desulfovibrio piger]
MEEFPVKAEVRADLTEAGTELAKGVRGGGSMLMEALFGRRLADARAHAERTQAQSAADARLIDAGLARYENGKIVYLADTAACAKFLVRSRDVRRAENLAACLDEAVKSIDKDPVFSLPGKDIDPDFLDDWQDTAERTNSEYMRRLWGRILKGELEQPGKYPRRVLNILRNLTMEEAQAFTCIARYAIGSMIVLTEEGFKKFLHMSSLLYDSGLFVNSNKRVESYAIDSKFAALPLCDCAIVLHFSEKLSGKYNLCSGYQLSHAGKSILDIPDVEPIQKYHLEKMFSVLKKDIPSLAGLTAHPRVSRDGYDSDVILCEYREDTGSVDGR